MSPQRMGEAETRRGAPTDSPAQRIKAARSPQASTAVSPLSKASQEHDVLAIQSVESGCTLASEQAQKRRSASPVSEDAQAPSYANYYEMERDRRRQAAAALARARAEERRNEVARRLEARARREAERQRCTEQGSEPASFCVADVKYASVVEAARLAGWRIVGEWSYEERFRKARASAEEAECNVYWLDKGGKPAITERLSQLKPWQCFNHFPGMHNIANKARMAQVLGRLQRRWPEEYNFYPRTWVLPGEMGAFSEQFDSRGVSGHVFIVKPDAGAKGRGIFLTNRLDDVKGAMARELLVAQRYLRAPLLIEGKKFDVRLYVFVPSVTPLRVYVFKDGLVRLAPSRTSTRRTPTAGESKRWPI